MSGVDSYNALCIAAKSEERRLQELKKRQQYSKVSVGSKPPARSSLTSKNTTNSNSSHSKGRGSSSRGSTEKRTCFVCEEPGHIASNCPKKITESRGRGKPPVQKSVTVGVSGTPLKQVQVAQSVETETPSSAEDLLGLLLSDSEDQVSLVQIQDSGSNAKGVVVQVQGVPAVGVIDSGSDLTITGAELFAKVAVTARLHKRDFKKADKVPRTYDQRTLSLDGRLDLDIEFDGKSLNTPVYVRKEAQDQLLLSEDVSRQLGIIGYHREVHLLKQLAKDPRNTRVRSGEREAQVPLVRVCLVQAVSNVTTPEHRSDCQARW